MPLTLAVTSEPAAEPVSLMEAKAHLRVDSDEDDSYISAIITAARRHVEEVTGRALITQTRTMRLDRFPRGKDNTIYLPRNPVQSVSSIIYIDGDGAEQTLSSSNYRVDAISEPARIEPGYELNWPATRDVINAVTITYVAGYGAAGSSVPADMRAAIKMLVGQMYEFREPEVTGTIVSAVRFAVDSLLSTYRIHWQW